MKTPTRYCLVEDGDGHFYIIPFARRPDWEDALRNDSVPEWAVQIDGPHLLSFTDWREETP